MKPIARKLFLFYLSVITFSYVFTLMMSGLTHEPLRPTIIQSLITGSLMGVFQIFMDRYNKKRNPEYRTTRTSKKIAAFGTVFLTIAYFFPLLMKVLFNYPVKTSVIIGFVGGLVAATVQVIILNRKQKQEALTTE